MWKTIAVGLGALIVAGLPGTASSAGVGRHVTVAAGDTTLRVSGVRSLRPGFVRISVRNAGRGEHGIQLVRLRRELSNAQLLTAFAAEDATTLASLGGVQEVAPGRTWEMTEKLGAGSYAFVDFGQNGPKPNYANGLFARFRVAAGPAAGAAPAAVGEIGMLDYRFRFGLPARFGGHGMLRIANRGRVGHEITLVAITGRHTQADVLRVILSGATAPPKWARVVELISVLDPGRTAYVNVDLRPGRYVALCLLDVPGSQKLQAQLGMIGTFRVGG